MEHDAEKIFTDLKEEVSAYAGLKFRLLKLIAVERAARVGAALSHGVFLTLLTFFTILFLFTALGFYLGELLDNIALGFLIVGGIYFLLTLCFVGLKGKIRVMLTNMIIGALQTNDNDDENEKDQSTNATRATVAGEKRDSTAVPGIGGKD